ncbi:hypothetical protein [Methylomonas koyamae]|uniref:hypothetical protein n=1 Tax=Methylomonas koyamae TaxID=702114 RepID=UPI0012F64D73|nr:hypothetical protein [Methylomonas koyamae]
MALLHRLCGLASLLDVDEPATNVVLAIRNAISRITMAKEVSNLAINLSASVENPSPEFLHSSRAYSPHNSPRPTPSIKTDSPHKSSIDLLSAGFANGTQARIGLGYVIPAQAMKNRRFSFPQNSAYPPLRQCH